MQKMMVAKMPYHLVAFMIFSVVFVFSCNYSDAHGFGPSTLVKNVAQSWNRIEQLFQVRESKQEYVACFDLFRNYNTTRGIKSARKSSTNCYFRIGFDEWFNDDVLCTPSQEFYMPEMGIWQPACLLKIGDLLLASDGEHKPITHIEFVKKSLDMYTIEVEEIHNFFVGRHAILTHNMALPLLTSVGISIAFGSGATAGGSAGGFFGPIGIVGGVVVGGIIGVAVTAFSNNKTMHYKLAFHPEKIDQLIHMNGNNEHAQAPGKPTEKDGFVPPKNWDGKKVKHRRGHGWPDKKGNIWIPTGPKGHGGPHWDVQFPNGDYENVVPGGKIRGQK